MFLVRKGKVIFFSRFKVRNVRCREERKNFFQNLLGSKSIPPTKRDEEGESSSFPGIALCGPIREEARFLRYRNNSSPPNVAYIRVYVYI